MEGTTWKLRWGIIVPKKEEKMEIAEKSNSRDEFRLRHLRLETYQNVDQFCKK